MKETIKYIQFRLVPALSFGTFLAVESLVLYGLYRAIIRQ